MEFMRRRQFLAASLATSALALTREASAKAGEAQAAAGAEAKGGRDFYQIRKYKLESGPQPKLTQQYFSEALIPALKKLGMGPVGAFSADFGPETPTYYLLIPGSSAEKLVEIDLHIAEDADFQKAAAPFWDAPASAPAFQRVDSELMVAFEGWPKMTLPSFTAAKAKRIFQLRTYESPSYKDHVNKVAMFHAGEFGIFKAAGFESVFYADVLIGQRTPCLTYMLSMPSLEELNAKWAAFGGNADWKKLSSDPKYSYEPTVSNITNLVLSPLGMSEI